MLTLSEYMKNVGVSKRKYVEDWLSKDLIPGVAKDENTGELLFPNSARRPYKMCSTYNVNRIYANIIKASSIQRHVTNKTFSLTQSEFESYINALINDGFIQKREEDGVTYYDATRKSKEQRDKKIIDIMKMLTELTTSFVPVLASVIQ